MKRIRMNVSETGRFPGRSGQYHVRGGKEYDVPDDVPEEVAQIWVDRGFAEEVRVRKTSTKGKKQTKTSDAVEAPHDEESTTHEEE